MLSEFLCSDLCQENHPLILNNVLLTRDKLRRVNMNIILQRTLSPLLKHVDLYALQITFCAVNIST